MIIIKTAYIQKFIKNDNNDYIKNYLIIEEKIMIMK